MLPPAAPAQSVHSTGGLPPAPRIPRPGPPSRSYLRVSRPFPVKEARPLADPAASRSLPAEQAPRPATAGFRRAAKVAPAPGGARERVPPFPGGGASSYKSRSILPSGGNSRYWRRPGRPLPPVSLPLPSVRSQGCTSQAARMQTLPPGARRRAWLFSSASHTKEPVCKERGSPPPQPWRRRHSPAARKEALSRLRSAPRWSHTWQRSDCWYGRPPRQGP